MERKVYPFARLYLGYFIRSWWWDEFRTMLETDEQDLSLRAQYSYKGWGLADKKCQMFPMVPNPGFHALANFPLIDYEVYIVMWLQQRKCGRNIWKSPQELELKESEFLLAAYLFLSRLIEPNFHVVLLLQGPTYQGTLETLWIISWVPVNATNSPVSELENDPLLIKTSEACSPNQRPDCNLLIGGLKYFNKIAITK